MFFIISKIEPFDSRMIRIGLSSITLWRLSSRRFTDSVHGKILAVHNIPNKALDPSLHELKELCNYVMSSFDTDLKVQVDQLSQSYRQLLADIEETKSAADSETSSEMIEALNLESVMLKEEQQKLESKLAEILSKTRIEQEYTEENERIILEIDSGSGGGGGETALQLYQAYCRYCTHMEWEIENETFEEIKNSVSKNIGYQKIEMTISGTNCRQYFDAERGTHKIYRTSGATARKVSTIWTFLVTVDVVPQLDKPKFDIPKEDIKIEGGSSGKGGSKMEKKNVRAIVTHLPTGIQVNYFNGGRDLVVNQKIALRRLYSILAEKHDREFYEKVFLIQFFRLHNHLQIKMLEQRLPSEDMNREVRHYIFKQNSVIDRFTGQKTTIDSFFKNGSEFLESVAESYVDDKKNKLERQKIETLLKKFNLAKIKKSDFSLYSKW